MRDNCIQVVQKLPVIYYYIMIPTNYNFVIDRFIVSYSSDKRKIDGIYEKERNNYM